MQHYQQTAGSKWGTKTPAEKAAEEKENREAMRRRMEKKVNKISPVFVETGLARETTNGIVWNYEYHPSQSPRD